MADLTSSAVTVSRDYTGGGNNGLLHSYRDVVLVLTVQGTAANKIPASVLELNELVGASVFRKDDDTVLLVAAPDYAGANLLLKAAATNAPADFTGTFKGTVWGFQY